MHAVRRNCSAATWGLPGVCESAAGPRRVFSRSCVRPRGALPVFLPPSSPELSSLLMRFNTKILLPEHLTKEQRALVYKRDNIAKLEAEPVEITLGEVTLPLEHLNRNHLPNRRRSFYQLVKKSTTAEDWENVVRLLQGLVNAGISVKTGWQEMIVRHLNKHGMQHLILKMLQRPKATGVTLREYPVLFEVLRGVHDKAALSDWDQDETKKALRLAKQVVELLDDEDHCGYQARGEMVSEHDWRGKPAIVALPTELAAVLADRHGGDVAEVGRLAARLTSALKQDDFAKTLDATAQKAALKSSDAPNGNVHQSHLMSLCQDLNQLTYIWNALKTTRKVLGATMPMAEEAQLWEKEIEQHLFAGVEAADRLKKRNDVVLRNTYVDYTRNAIERCQ